MKCMGKTLQDRFDNDINLFKDCTNFQTIRFDRCNRVSMHALCIYANEFCQFAKLYIDHIFSL